MWPELRAILREAEARELYEGPLCEHEVNYAEAFPEVVVEDA